MTQRGVTLVELLITIVIGSIAFFPLAIPFVADRSFWGTGKRQTEAQRDAQVALRTIARAARQGFVPNPAPGVTDDELLFTTPCPLGSPSATDTVRFSGGSAFGNRLDMVNNCSIPATTSSIIDGVRSRVTELVFTGVTNQLVRVRIRVTYENLQQELLETEIFFRNQFSP